jgi:hypothetical protein
MSRTKKASVMSLAGYVLAVACSAEVATGAGTFSADAW